MPGRLKRNIGGLYAADIREAQAAMEKEDRIFQEKMRAGVHPFEAWGQARGELRPEEAESLEVALQDAAGERVLEPGPRSDAGRQMFERRSEPRDVDAAEIPYQVPAEMGLIRRNPRGGVEIVPMMYIDEPLSASEYGEFAALRVENLAALGVEGAQEALDQGNEGEFLEGYDEGAFSAF